MDTILDTRYEIELTGIHYDGDSLVASVTGLAPDIRRRLKSDDSEYLITFARPVMHLLTEEFPASIANLVQGTDSGFLRTLDNSDLRSQLGVNVEPFLGFTLYALITASEILIALCPSAPHVEHKV